VAITSLTSYITQLKLIIPCNTPEERVKQTHHFGKLLLEKKNVYERKFVDLCMSYCSDDMSMERCKFYILMGDEKIWKTVPSFKETSSKEIRLRKGQSSEEALYKINYPLRLQVHYPLVDFIMKGTVKYLAGMLAICHLSHAASFGTKIFGFMFSLQD
jgi:hypothetical protein